MAIACCVVSGKYDYWIFGDVTMQDDGYYWTVELEQLFNETFKEDENERTQKDNASKIDTTIETTKEIRSE